MITFFDQKSGSKNESIFDHFLITFLTKFWSKNDQKWSILTIKFGQNLRPKPRSPDSPECANLCPKSVLGRCFDQVWSKNDPFFDHLISTWKSEIFTNSDPGMGPTKNRKNRPRKSNLTSFLTPKSHYPRAICWSELASVYQASLGFITSQCGRNFWPLIGPKVSSFNRETWDPSRPKGGKADPPRFSAVHDYEPTEPHVKIATFCPFKGQKVSSFKRQLLRPRAHRPIPRRRLRPVAMYQRLSNRQIPAKPTPGAEFQIKIHFVLYCFLTKSKITLPGNEFSKLTTLLVTFPPKRPQNPPKKVKF